MTHELEDPLKYWLPPQPQCDHHLFSQCSDPSFGSSHRNFQHHLSSSGVLVVLQAVESYLHIHRR